MKAYKLLFVLVFLYVIPLKADDNKEKYTNKKDTSDWTIVKDRIFFQMEYGLNYTNNASLPEYNLKDINTDVNNNYSGRGSHLGFGFEYMFDYKENPHSVELDVHYDNRWVERNTDVRFFPKLDSIEKSGDPNYKRYEKFEVSYLAVKGLYNYYVLDSKLCVSLGFMVLSKNNAKLQNDLTPYKTILTKEVHRNNDINKAENTLYGALLRLKYKLYQSSNFDLNIGAAYDFNITPIITNSKWYMDNYSLLVGVTVKI